jgi:hypothetical protein
MHRKLTSIEKKIELLFMTVLNWQLIVGFGI